MKSQHFQTLYFVLKIEVLILIIVQIKIINLQYLVQLYLYYNTVNLTIIVLSMKELYKKSTQFMNLLIVEFILTDT